MKLPAASGRGIENIIKPALNCDNLKTGIINNDQQMVGNEIDKLCVDLETNVTKTDKWGHKENMNTLVAKLNKACDINVELLHYAGIETYPP